MAEARTGTASVPVTTLTRRAGEQPQQGVRWECDMAEEGSGVFTVEMTERATHGTEIILHLYEEKGEDCVQDLNGMFAFAIWNTRAQKLFIARDRVGVKPLYYCLKNGYLLFASELKSLLAIVFCFLSITEKTNESKTTQYTKARTTTVANMV